MIATQQLHPLPASSFAGLKDATSRLHARQEAQARELVEAMLALPRRETSAAVAAFFDTFAAHCAALAAASLPTVLNAR